MNYLKTSTIVLSIALCSVIHNLCAQENNSNNIQISIFADPGISGAYGEYPSEYNSKVEFSFNAGARIRLNQAFGAKMML